MSYDMLMRVPLLCWVTVVTVMQSMRLVHSIHVTDITITHMAMRCSMIAFLILLGVTVLIRTPPLAKASGWEPRISAFAGSFLIYGIALFPRRELSPSIELVSACLLTFGSVAACIALSQLGRSFSMMAESRQLVTNGPYKWVRHPLYLAEEIAIIGAFMQFASIWTMLILAAQIAFQLRRVHNEEMILKTTFPAYAIYQQDTYRLFPGVY